MCEHCKGIDLRALAGQTAAFARERAESYPRVLEPELRRTLGIGFAELRRADLPRFFRARRAGPPLPQREVDRELRRDDARPRDRRSRQDGVTFDIESRPNKSPRAFCAPVRVPGEVYLVVAPVGGWDDYVTLFHEGGHTEHGANVDPELPFEFRCLGDNSISETYAFLLQHLVEDPEWLSRRLGVEDASELVAHAQGPAARLPAPLRGQDRLRARAPRRRRRTALGRARRPLLGAARRRARRSSGRPRRFWPTSTRASTAPATCGRGRSRPICARTCASGSGRRGSSRTRRERCCAGLWRDGQRLDAEELLGELTGARLDFGAVLADLGLAGG